MRNRLLGFILFAAAFAVLIGVLKVLNWVPGVMQDGLLKSYATIDEAKTALKISEPFAPTYYPQGLRWPPERIMAQTKPYLMILQEYARQKDGAVTLIIVQTARGHGDPKLPVEMTRKTEQVTFDLKGRSAFLEVGMCGDDVQCSRLNWAEGDSRIMMIMLTSPSEIVKIADSMIMGTR
jgi:hypothetical protein